MAAKETPPEILEEQAIDQLARFIALVAGDLCTKEIKLDLAPPSSPVKEKEV